MRERRVFRDTTSDGIPMGPASHFPAPKSAGTGSFRPIELISCAESADTGSLSTRWFHGLFAGKTEQCRAAGSRSAWAADPVKRTAARPAASAAARVTRFMALSSAGALLILSAVMTAPLRRVLVVDD